MIAFPPLLEKGGTGWDYGSGQAEERKQERGETERGAGERRRTERGRRRAAKGERREEGGRGRA